MKEAAIVFVFIALAAWGIVWLLTEVVGVQTNRENTVYTNFKTSCDGVGGKTTWNGRNWECLK